MGLRNLVFMGGSTGCLLRRARAGAFGLISVGVLLAPMARAGDSAETSKMRCVIDMGSNSFKRIVGSFRDGRYVQEPLVKMTVGAGDDLARHGEFSESKLREIEGVLRDMAADCRRSGDGFVKAVATAAFRESPNAWRVREIAERLGISLEIASEERESRLAYLVGSLGREDYAIVDNGSRSIELAAKPVGQDLRFSVFNLGYRIAHTRFFVDSDDPAEAIAAYRRQVEANAGPSSFMQGRSRMIAVEFEEMAEVLFPPGPIEGRVFTRQELEQRLAEIAGGDAASFRDLKMLKDIDRALPRLVVAATLLELFGYEEIELTERELGTGLIIEAGLDAGDRASGRNRR